MSARRSRSTCHGAATSTIGDFADIDQNLPLLAIRGFGQNDDQMVPIHMAMVAATVANDGEMMEPFVVDAELDHDGRVISRTQPDVWKRPISRRTAGILQDLMVGGRRAGTASCCIALEGGIPVAAKTGTAQLNGPGEPERSHAWIVAYAPAEDTEVRRRRDAQGHQRRDLRRHRRPPRRPDRQGDARRGCSTSTRPTPASGTATSRRDATRRTPSRASAAPDDFLVPMCGVDVSVAARRSITSLQRSPVVSGRREARHEQQR